VALDASREMLDAARGKGSFERLRGDAIQLPFREGVFDATAFVMVLHQVRPWESAVREAARVSRKVVIATTDMATRDLGILGEAFPSLARIDRSRFPPIDTIAQSLLAAGFSQVRIEERPLRRLLTVEQQLDRVRRRYLSTFDLLPPGEYERGLRFLEDHLPIRFPDGFELRASYTFIGATR
ncbi:MAG: class I SAM-dependent methyltransferase, partial [Thermoplasmata archaeon]|nr:class I SAM-dependent methyltransferase [Thermoplasmata archaeon]